MENKLKALDKKYYWMIAFALSALGMFLVFVYKGMLFSDGIILRSDMLAGSMAGIKDVARCILNGENLFFTFNIGMGINNALAVASNAMSPFNILYLILFNVDDNIVTAIVTILKVGCIAAAFQYFSRRVLKYDGFFSIIISVFYALSAFVIAYGSIHIMWMDAIMLLPLLCVAIVRCIEERKRAMLIVLYVYLFLAQFYMAYMVGIFTLLFTVCYLAFMYETKEGKPKYKQILNAFFDWFLSGVIAVMLSAFFWAPVLFFIMANRVEDSTEVFEISASLLQILNSLFWGKGYGIEGTYAYIYCGVPALVLAPLYFINKEIKCKEKIFYGVMLGILFLCTIVTKLNSFMHVFDQPDSFWYRYSFLISFLICAVMGRQFANMKEMKLKVVGIIVAVVALFYQMQQQLNGLQNIDTALNPTLNSGTGFLINIVLILSWCAIIFLYFKKENWKKILCILSCILVVVEMSTSGIAEVPKVEEAESYYEWYATLKDAADHINANDDGLFRTVCTNSLSANADTWFGFNGISDFGDEEKYSVRNFLSNMGFATSTRWVNDTGYTPVTNMLLGIKYNIVRQNPLIDFEPNAKVNEHNYMINDEALNFGYMVDGKVILYNYEGRNIFENMNSLVSSMTGNDADCYDRISSDKITFDNLGCSYSIDNENQYCYVQMEDAASSLYVTVKDPDYKDVYMQIETDDIGYYLYDFYVMGVQNSGATTYISARFSNANQMYYNEEKDKFNLYLYAEEAASPEKLEFQSLNVYGVNEANFQVQHDELASQQLEISEWSNGHILGKVNVTDDKRLMFLSIPYDPGWSAYVDGKETEIVRLIDGSFMGVFVKDGGEHEIELKYEAPGFKVGLAVSLCGIIAFLSVIFEKQLKALKKKTEITGKKTESEDNKDGKIDQDNKEEDTSLENLK